MRAICSTPKTGRAFACPSEQESLFKNIARLSSTHAAATRLELRKALPGSVP
jgi:hypothetical protein